MPNWNDWDPWKEACSESEDYSHTYDQMVKQLEETTIDFEAMFGSHRDELQGQKHRHDQQYYNNTR